ncbi:MAG: y4mF family transcriptional regulator [Cryomorphaceae bacterium]|jgi:y4mF family transcriptional regulator
MDTKHIGNYLRKRRKVLKISQEDLADIAGVSERTLRDIEKGIANPELASLIKVCEVLGLRLNLEVIQ